MKIIGIYCIRNVVNGKIYIGSSNDVSRRFRGHKSNLNKGKHANPHLQSSWDKYGADSFEFYILEECKESVLMDRENHYIYKHKCLDNKYGYNLTDADRHIVSEEVRKNMSKAKLNMTQEKKDLWAERSPTRFKKGQKVWNKGNSGYKQSKECCKNHSKANKKRYENLEERKKTSEANKKRYSDPLEREKTSKATKAYLNGLSKEEKDKQNLKRSNAMKAYWAKRKQTNSKEA